MPHCEHNIILVVTASK